MVLLGGMFLGHMRLLTQTAASQPPWISGTATSRWTSRATTSVRYDTDAGCESAPAADRLPVYSGTHFHRDPTPRCVGVEAQILVRWVTGGTWDWVATTDRFRRTVPR